MRKKGEAAACVLAGIACAMAFLQSPEGYVGRSALPAASASYLWSGLALAFAALFGATFALKRLRPRLPHVLFGLLFGVANGVGMTLFAYDSLSPLGGFPALALATLRWLGQGLPMMAALTLLDAWLREGRLTGRSAAGIGIPGFPARLCRLYRANPALAAAGLLLLCWTPYLIVFFPGTLSWDVGEMLAQFFGLREMDTWHPVFLTWLAGGFFQLGRLAGSDNLGAALFTLLQSLLLAYALGSAVAFIRRRGGGRGVQLAALGFFGLVPLWGGYAQFICKDTLYTAFLLLFTLRVLELLDGERPRPRRFWVGWGLSALLSCLIRSNGVYVVLPTALLVALFGAQGKNRLRAGAALGSAVLCALLFSGALLPALGIRDETASGIYSVCFQQSARVLRDHGEQVTPEEYAEIDRVLEAESLPERYEPWISDPVKYTFRQYGLGAAAEKEALARYRSAWLSMLRKYPLTYLEAFVAGNSAYYAFTPKLEGVTYNQQAGNRLVFETHPQVATNLGVHTACLPGLDTARTLLAAFARGIRHIPLLSLAYCCAAYTWLLAGAGVSLGRRSFRRLIGFAPALLSLGVCLLSPVNDYFRYFLPIAAMAFPLLVFADEGNRGKGRAQDEALTGDAAVDAMARNAA